ncbi:MAG: pilus assembly protein N-terminal domain-containing protein [Alphaproteobacteria bacterium]|jgi:Flp pilus assembly secretin CpaC
MRKPFLTRNRLAATALCAVLTTPFAALAADFTVPMDQVRMITFRAPISTVFVGNPLIADVTVVDPTRIFLMGKNFGTTNLVALDEDGNQISNDRITVQSRDGEVVTIHRGSDQMTMACLGGRCQSAPVPGDAVEEFEAVSEQMTARDGEIASAAGGDQ